MYILHRLTCETTHAALHNNHQRRPKLPGLFRERHDVSAATEPHQHQQHLIPATGLPSCTTLTKAPPAAPMNRTSLPVSDVMGAGLKDAKQSNIALQNGHQQAPPKPRTSLTVSGVMGAGRKMLFSGSHRSLSIPLRMPQNLPT